MRRIPREQFVSTDSLPLAYADQALQISCGQTISQPYMVALMTETLALSGNERVLEIGTGSGYQTAVLAELAAHVFTVERHRLLQTEAKSRLERLELSNIAFHNGDGTGGWAEHAPYDRVLITCASAECPPALWDQLEPEGILVGPFGPRHRQMLQAWRKRGNSPIVTDVTPCQFVPLVAGLPAREA